VAEHPPPQAPDTPGARHSGLCVAGLGQPFRGDDGVGPLVVAALAKRLPDAAQCLIHVTDPIDLVEHWRGCRLAIVVDATQGAGKPGTITHFDSAAGPVPTAPEAFTSTHGFGLAQAIAMARALGSLPGRLLVFGVEGRAFGPGAELSPAVRRALTEATRRIEGVIRAHREGQENKAREKTDHA